MTTIVIKPNLGVDLAKGWVLGDKGWLGSNRENWKNTFEVLIFYMKNQEIIHVDIVYTCCKQLNLKDYLKRFSIPHWKDTIMFFLVEVFKPKKFFNPHWKNITFW
jgi:hypothetical protein